LSGGAWIKHRVDRGQEFVIGGYFPGPHGFDSLIVGYFEGEKLMYVARTRNGFVPASRRQVFSKLKHLVTPSCTFVNLPETRRSRFGEELNAEKIKKAVWLRPEAVAQIEFLEWTEGKKTASDYTRSSSTDREVSDHPSLSSALWPRV
jgi:ATP-dependent DNA ligase